MASGDHLDNHAKPGTSAGPVVMDTEGQGQDQKNKGGQVKIGHKLLLVLEFLGLEGSMTYEQLYLIPILQTLGMPLSIASLVGLVSGPVGAVLVPLLGWLSDRGSNPNRRKLLGSLCTTGVMVLGLAFVITANCLHLRSPVSPRVNGTNISMHEEVDMRSDGNDSSFVLSSDVRKLTGSSQTHLGHLPASSHAAAETLSTLFSGSNARTTLELSLEASSRGTVEPSRATREANLTRSSENVTNANTAFELLSKKRETATTGTEKPALARTVQVEASTSAPRSTSSATMPDSGDEISAVPFTAGLSMFGFIVFEVGFDQASTVVRAWILACSPHAEHTSLLVLGLVLAGVGMIVTSALGRVDFPALLKWTTDDQLGNTALIIQTTIQGAVIAVLIVLGLVSTLLTGRTLLRRNYNTANNCDDTTKKKNSDNTTEEKLNSANTTEEKNSDDTTEKKNSANTTKEKNSDSTTKKKNSANTTEDKNSDNTTEKNNSDNTTEKKNSANTTEKKPSDNTTEKNNSDSTTEKKNSDNTTEKNNSDNTTETEKNSDNTYSETRLSTNNKNDNSENDDVKAHTEKTPVHLRHLCCHQTQPDGSANHSRDLETSCCCDSKTGRFYCKMFSICVGMFFTCGAHDMYTYMISDYVGKAVYGGDPMAQAGSEGLVSYLTGVRTAAWGMLVYSVCYLLINLVHTHILKFLGHKMEFVLVQLLLGGCMVVQALTARIEVFYVLSAVAGLHRACLYVVAFVAANDVIQQQVKGRGVARVGLAMSVVGAMIPLSITALFPWVGPLTEWTGIAATPLWVGVVFSCLAAFGFLFA